jgi:two-component system sensor histidine kinase and response regulator WspE
MNRERILIIDDDHFLLKIYADRLRKHGFVVEPFCGGKDGIDCFSGDFAPHVVIIDTEMVEMDGFEVLKEIKKRNKNDKLIVVVVSNRGDQEEIKKAIDLGVDSYIVKASITPAELVEVVEQLIDRRS